MLINISEIKGEPGTGYENGKLGEFECANCHYFRKSNSSCGQKIMTEKSKLPKTSDGRILVDPEGCCEFVDRVGISEDEDEDENMEKKHDVSLYRAMHHLKKGGLHRALGVPEGEKIPDEKLASARNSDNEHVRKMASFAHTMGSFKH